VESGAKIYFTIPVEAVFNQHPDVARAALVGVKKDKESDKVPVICIELVKNRKRKIYLYKELRSMASENSMTECIQHFIVHPRFPVDPRHNAKIFREKLSEWANLKLKL
jgi:acyl-coenzyme A synthetase/AMP-(fatty) acid ligase